MTIDFDKGNGLVPVIAQDSASGSVLMVAYMNRDAFEHTRAKGFLTLYSRSKKRLWTKGEASGNRMRVDRLLLDCDRDAILARVTPEGPACHTGAKTCFGDDNPGSFLDTLERVLIDRRDSNGMEASYTSRLIGKGRGAIAQKVGEEASELVIELVSGPDQRVIEESADLIYHVMVAMVERGLSMADVISVLKSRHRVKNQSARD
jgi:phosphoribosyl-ATP pyrophosphohydrolase/phosphoribosyl-AMP cyclohydrolase